MHLGNLSRAVIDLPQHWRGANGFGYSEALSALIVLQVYHAQSPWLSIVLIFSSRLLNGYTISALILAKRRECFSVTELHCIRSAL